MKMTNMRIMTDNFKVPNGTPVYWHPGGATDESGIKIGEVCDAELGTMTIDCPRARAAILEGGHKRISIGYGIVSIGVDFSVQGDSQPE